MAILVRIAKILKADIHGVMDHLEDRGLLLKQHLRDMEDALRCKEANLQKVKASHIQRQQELIRYERQLEALENDLTMAVQKGKDDIARMLIKKLRPLEHLKNELLRHVQTLEEEMTQIEDHLRQARLKYEQIKTRSTEYLHQAQMQKWQQENIDPVFEGSYAELSEQEIELELMKRKDMLSSTVSR